jgi:hypothetical protein
MCIFIIPNQLRKRCDNTDETVFFWDTAYKRAATLLGRQQAFKIQELKEGVQPDTSFNVDDFEKEAINVASDLGATLTVETIKPFNKDQYMFIMAMTKSALESKGIQCNKESIDSFIKDMKLIYSYNF